MLMMTRDEVEHFWRAEVLIFGAMYGYLRKPEAIQRLDAAVKHISKTSLSVGDMMFAQSPEQVHRDAWRVLRAAHKMVQEGAV